VLRFGCFQAAVALRHFLLVLLITALGVHIDWTWKRKLAPRGGRYFIYRLELAVPSFRQFDEKWRDDPLGGIAVNGTLGAKAVP
jgi:hypothetical protein